MIGVDKQGFGYGNISIRKDRTKHFFITGSETGAVKSLGEEHYCLVTDYNILSNSLSCKGPVKASSESMSHAAVYDSVSEINAVIHIHHHNLWNTLLDKVPVTPEHVEYGTPEMAESIKRLLKIPGVKEKRIIVMAGHTDGILFFGKHLDEAGAYTLSYFNETV